MSRLIFLSIFLFFCAVHVNSQEQLSYTSKSGKVEFTISPNEFYVEFESKDVNLVKTIGRGKLRRINSNAVIIKQEDLTGNFSSRKKQLNNLFSYIFHRIEPILIFSDGTKQMAKGEINIQIKKGYKIEDVIRGYDFEIKPLFVEDNLFTVFSVELTTSELFNRIEVLENDERVEFAEPNFIREIKPSTVDPYFNAQWAIHNPGNFGWTAGADMKVEQAWNYATGSGVKVAIIDDGVDLNHPDLQANLLPGFDATGGDLNGGPAFFPIIDSTGNPPETEPMDPPHDDYHGTACAGIVAAVANNNIGIAGVAHNAKIIPVRIGYSNGLPWSDNNREWITMDSWKASGINWAWQNGADILSNSWSGGGSSSNLIEIAINNATNNGRGGKGSIVLCSSGNQGSAVKFPASLDNVIAVGASSPCDTPKTSFSCDGEDWGSNSGQGLNVLAPGVKIYTTDLSGTAGDNTTDYVSDFSGTSASCPYAAAVCALILSMNTNLTGVQVRNILETTCDKIGDFSYTTISGQPNGTWYEDVGYGRVNACKAVTMASLGVDPFLSSVITTNTTLFASRYATGNIVIEPGVTLTIKSTMYFGDNMKIIIKPGAKLIIDGGTLTNSGACGSFWQGIEVYGTSSQHQYPSNNPTYQGMLIVKNGGIIENAHIGATNWKKDDYTKIGGVIQANGGVFRNNRRDVVFMAYSNFSETNPAIKRANLSYFNNTDFLSDNNFIEKGLAIQSHVSMWQVSGINFTNCRFANNITNKLNSTAPNTAISSIDAGYKIDAACSTTPPLGQPCPSGNLLKSSFTGFNTAIDANGLGTTETVTIQQSNFTNNVNGIRIDDFDNVSINRNSINIGSAGYPFFLQGTGISMTNSTGYIVEENTISKTAVTPTYGIIVDNSGTANNRLYKNTLNGLTYGNYFSKVNKNLVLMGGTNTGLQFLCNSFSNNSNAAYITTSTDWTYGIKLYQGEATKSAGNVFSGNTNSISNSSIWTVNYYHHGGTSIPTSNVGSVTLYAATANTCPSSFGGGLILMKGQSNGYLDSLTNQSQNLQTTYNELYYTCLSQLDGGNTEELKSKIENNWSEDAWILRANLLEKSPYLSADILLKTAQLGILPNAMLLEICMANPDATKSGYFTEKLNEVTNGTFPQYMQEYIRTNDKKTARTQLESQMASVYSELSTTKNFIKNSTATKDEYTTADRYSLSANGKELSDKIAQMDFCIENSQWAKADSVLQIIQNDKTYQDNLSLLEDFDKYIAFRAGLGERTLAELKDYEISFLQELAVKEQRISGYARNILCYFYQLCYDKEYTDDNATQKIMLQKEQNSYLEPIETTLYSVSIYPNPAKEFVNLSWEILDELKECHYQVVNLNGQLVEKGIIPQNKGELTLDTRNYQNGIYVISVFNGNELKATKKLVVEKGK